MEINKGFFVINGGAFVKDETKRHATLDTYKFNNAKEVKYIVREGLIMVDADSEESRDKIIKLNQALGIHPYSYETSPGHMHFWYKTNENSQKLINDFKLHSSAHKLALDDKIDTRSFNTSTKKTGAVYLKTNNKKKSGRPNSKKLLEELKKPLPEVPLFLILPKDIGFIPKSGEDWNNVALPICGKLKFKKYNINFVNKLFEESAKYHGDAHSVSEISHKWEDAQEIKVGKYTKDDFHKFVYWDDSLKTPKWIIKYNGAADVIIDENNIMYYKGNIPVVKNEEGDREVLQIPIKKFAKRVITAKRMNLRPGIINDIAETVENSIQFYYPKISDDIIYFKNGDLNIKTGEFIEIQDPEWNHRRLQLDYVKPSSNTQQRINKLFTKFYHPSNKELPQQISELFACILVPTSVHRKMFQLYGNGHNGKSSMVEIFLQAIGESKIATLEISQIINSSFNRIALPNKMINWIDDLNKTRNKNIGALKTMVAGGDMNAEIKNGEIINFKNEATLVFGANFHLDANDGSDSITERLHIIHFNKKIIKNNTFRIENYSDKDFLEGLLYLAANTAITLYKKNWKLTVSTLTKIAMEEQKMENNSVYAWLKDTKFIEDHLSKVGAEIPTKEAFDNYVNWCNDNGIYSKSQTNFGKEIFKNKTIGKKQKQIDKKRINYYYYIGNIEEMINANDNK